MTTAGKNRNQHLLLLLPLAGILLSLILFIVAMCLYPGGSPYDEHAKGYSLRHNYLYNLLSETALGIITPSRPVAIAALVCIVTALSLFWYFVPRIPCLIALILTFRKLYYERQVIIFQWGLVALATILLMMFVYYTNVWIQFLPVIQKLALLTAISWFVLVIISLYRRAQGRMAQQAPVSKEE